MDPYNRSSSLLEAEGTSVQSILRQSAFFRGPISRVSTSFCIASGFFCHGSFHSCWWEIVWYSHLGISSYILPSQSTRPHQSPRFKHPWNPRSNSRLEEYKSVLHTILSRVVNQISVIFFSPSTYFMRSIYRLLIVYRAAGVRQKSIALYSYGTYIISVGR